MRLGYFLHSGGARVLYTMERACVFELSCLELRGQRRELEGRNGSLLRDAIYAFEAGEILCADGS